MTMMCDSVQSGVCGIDTPVECDQFATGTECPT